MRAKLRLRKINFRKGKLKLGQPFLHAGIRHPVMAKLIRDVVFDNLASDFANAC